MKKFLVILITVFFLWGTSFGSIVMNNISEIIPPESGSEIEKRLILGSVSFLNAFGSSNELLSHFENSGISEFDVTSSLNLVNNALDEIDRAISYYKDAKSLADKSGYLTEKAEIFRSFDYDSLSISMEFPVIFQKVKRFMANNDVIGIHSENIKNIETIREDLLDVKNALIAGSIPSKEQMWKILIDFTKASIFANYATRVGSAVLSN